MQICKMIQVATKELRNFTFVQKKSIQIKTISTINIVIIKNTIKKTICLHTVCTKKN